MEIVAKEMIKPSSPTPHDLRIHKLSFLDQIAPPIYTPLIFFYEASQVPPPMMITSDSLLIMMKESLSKALTCFYPLAGRISCSSRQGVVIDCNDAGALFVEARVHGHLLQEVVDSPKMEQLREYLPRLEQASSGAGAEEENNILLAVQVNIFDCKGIAVGVKMSHKIADGTSLVTFMNAWSKICHGDEEGEEEEIFKQYSSFAGMGTNLFPPRDLTSLGFRPTAGIINKEKIVAKRVIFSKEKLAKLKELYTSSAPAAGSKVLANRDDDGPPTRVELVSAFIWKHFIEMHKHKTKTAGTGGSGKMVAAVHAVNLRPRINPALPDHVFGNIWRHTLAMPKEESGYHSLVGQLRTSIKTINSNYVKSKVQTGDEYIKIFKNLAELYFKGEVELCNFSSWCRFPVYEVDYGWGKPLWVCTATLPFKNVAIFMSTKNGDGIEAWINMLEDDASILERGLDSINTY